MKLKGCPKCGGAICVESDRYGGYVHCLMCGWHQDLAPGPSLPKTADHPSENVRAPDNGCSVAQSCFQCPLPGCKYDMPSARDAYLRDQALLAVFRQHQHLGTKVAAELTAEVVGTSNRRVHRVLARQRKTA
jgi:hypothetical protein